MYAMAKLSVYNTIDRSQLGGKFVPLIQSGVNNYKILASDLGKEYSPGDAIDITDTGVINVNYDPETLRLSGSGLGVKTDAARGVFGGSNGIYIASADSSINITSSGIKVNAESLIGPGLDLHAGNMISVKTNAPLYSYDHGVSLSIGGDLYVTNEGALYVNSAAIRDSAKQHVYKYIGNSLSVDQGYLVVNTNYIASGFGLTTGYGEYGPISVDIEDVASAIGNNYIGSGLYFNNSTYTFSANVNTATGIIVKDNKLYLNSGDGLQTSNNTLSVKLADNSIAVLAHDGIKVNTGYGLSATSDGLYVKSADNSIDVYADGIKVNVKSGGGILSGEQGLYFDSSIINIPSVHSYAGYGLSVTNNGLYVQSANNSIGVSSNGIKVNTDNSTLKSGASGLYVNTAYVSGAIAGEGLDAGDTSGKMNVKAADNSIYVYSGGVRVRVREGGGILSGVDGLYLDSGAIELPSAGSLSGAGLGHTHSNIYVMSADNSIGVSNDGIKVNTYKLAGYGLSAASYGLSVHLYGNTNIKISDDGGYLYAAADFMSGEGLKAMHGTALGVNYGSGLGIDNNGLLTVKLGDRLGFDPYGYVYAASSYTVGPGLTHSSGALKVRPANNSIGVSEHGVKVNPSALVGPGLKNHGDSHLMVHAIAPIYVDQYGVALEISGCLDVDRNGRLYVRSGSGLVEDHGVLHVKSADSSIGVTDAGIKVNTSALAGASLYVDSANKTLNVEYGDGLTTGAGELKVQAADTTISVGSGGISVNTVDLSHALAGNGLTASNAGLYVKSADNSIGADARGIYIQVADHSIGVGSHGIYLKTADNSISVHTNGIKVDPSALVGKGLGGDGGTLYVVSANDSIVVSEHGIKVDPSAITGSGLVTTNGAIGVNVNTSTGIIVNDNRLYLNAGYGLHTTNNTVRVKAADSTINVSSSGIKVNRSALSIPTALSLAGNGLTSGGSHLYVQSADGSIGVGVDGIKVNAASGLETTPNGLYVKSADNTIGVSSHGIKVNTLALAGGGLAEHVDGGSLQVLPSDSTISVSSSGVSVNYGLSLTKDASGRLISALYAGSGVKLKDNYISLHTGDGLEINDNGAVYVKSADNTISVSEAGIKVNTSALPTSTAESFAGHGLTANPYSGKLDIYCGSGLDIDKSLGKVIVKSADNSIDVSDNGIKVRTYDNQGVFVGNHGVYTRSADSSIGLSTAGIKVNVKSGGGILVGDQGLYIHNTSSSSGIEGVSVYTDGGSSSASRGSISIGGYSSANGENSVVIGKLATTGAYEAVIIGYCASAHSTSYDNIAVGSESYSRSSYSIAIGSGSKSYSYSSIAIGRGSVSTGDNSIAIGDLSNTFSAHSIAIGSESYAYSASSIAIGLDSTVKGPNSIAIGSESYANSASTIAIGYSSSSGTNSVAIGAGSSAPNTYCLSAGYMSSATGTESVALGVNSDASSFGVAIGSQSNALEYGVAIGYNASATKGIISLRVAHSTGEHFEYKYGYDGSLIDKDTSGANYTRSWENLLTPPDYSAAVSINVNTEYTADKPAYIAFNVYAGGAKVYVVEFIKNDVPVFSVGVLYGLSIYNIIPIAKGDKYKLSVTNHGAVNPAIYAYIIYPQ